MKQTVRNKFRCVKNERGVALIIVLLVTALLIALVFEFAYSTRVTMHAAQNFRDGQRAYFLALSGIKYFNAIQSQLGPQGELPEVPFSTGDTVLSLKWEDESGKINFIDSGTKKTITNTSQQYPWLVELFNQKGVSQSVLHQIISTDNTQILMLSDLHKYMSDEDYAKVSPFLTVNQQSGNLININTADEMVLIAAAVPRDKVTAILSDRKEKNLDAQYLNDKGLSSTLYSVSSSGSKIYSSATVGGYTKIIEVIPGRTASDYWKSL